LRSAIRHRSQVYTKAGPGKFSIRRALAKVMEERQVQSLVSRTPRPGDSMDEEVSSVLRQALREIRERVPASASKTIVVQGTWRRRSRHTGDRAEIFVDSP
jgi:hypothetical protein